jgi:hypothetical protein
MELERGVGLSISAKNASSAGVSQPGPYLRVVTCHTTMMMITTTHFTQQASGCTVLVSKGFLLCARTAVNVLTGRNSGPSFSLSTS